MCFFQGTTACEKPLLKVFLFLSTFFIQALYVSYKLLKTMSTR